VTVLEVIGIQHPAGRKNEHVIVIGIRGGDPHRKPVRVHATMDDAVELIAEAQAVRAFPLIEVEDWAWMHIIQTGDIKLVHFQEPQA
jgi:hypothetical protein